MRPVRPGCIELWAASDQQEDSQPVRPSDNQVEELARARVDPVHILEDHQDRLTAREALDPAQQNREGLLALAMRGRRK